MKPLFSALLETIVLVVSIFLVMLCAKLLKFESNFDNYSEIYPDSAITVGNALGYFPEGTTPTPDEASEILGQRFFGEDSGKKFPAPIAKFFCTEVSENTAKVLELYYFIVFIESILCLIFGITLPCSLYRHIDPAKSINNFPDSAKLKKHDLPKSPKIWYNRSIRKAEKQHRKGEEKNAENRDSNK
ncbi:MAG: hypothetical protein SOT68_09490 [Oscillospiraceae bacterium]|nr:hypothetical protein [Oscillospiraceae bacterium]MDY2864411.1 hypothetical protein [Oscillospiraceae bacterium]